MFKATAVLLLITIPALLLAGNHPQLPSPLIRPAFTGLNPTRTLDHKRLPSGLAALVQTASQASPEKDTGKLTTDQKTEICIISGFVVLVIGAIVFSKFIPRFKP